MSSEIPKIDFIQQTTETVFDIASYIILRLSEIGETIGVAESLTAGSLMAALASIPGASNAFRGGVVSYATPLKHKLLNVDAGLIAREGVVNAEVATQMAEGARQITNCGVSPTTWGLATTGVAGPASQDGKPVGMVYIGIASPNGSQAWGPFYFAGDRERIQKATVLEALSRLRDALACKSE